MNNLKNRTVWVVGGGSGIGRAISVKTALEGAKVWISGRNIVNLNETAGIIKRKHGSARVSVCDAVDYLQVKKTADEIINKDGRIDTLVVSIGRAIPGSLLDTSFENWKDLQSQHLDSLFLCCRQALAGLKKSKNANILVIGSIFGLKGKENRLAYCTVKGGVANFVRALALDLAGKVRVNSICPGWVQTEMSMKLVDATEDPKATLKARHGWHPIGRGGTPEEVADLAMYLISDKASWMTGQNIALDGGYTAR
ncbi:SDR family oxidoreductase [bacterium]|nr:MAG: SDR family oxidoreductase [bacterium]